MAPDHRICTHIRNKFDIPHPRIAQYHEKAVQLLPATGRSAACTHPVSSVSVPSVCTPASVVTGRTALSSVGPCGTFSPAPHSSALFICHFGYPSIVLLSFPDSFPGLFRPVRSLSFFLLSATKLHFSPAFSYILSPALTVIIAQHIQFMAHSRKNSPAHLYCTHIADIRFPFNPIITQEFLQNAHIKHSVMRHQ